MTWTKLPLPCRVAALLVGGSVVVGCGRSPSGTSAGQRPPPATVESSPEDGTQPLASSPAPTSKPGAPTAPPAPAEVNTAAYPWHGDSSLKVGEPAAHLERRFPPPTGFTRVPLPAASFGRWLRGLPLAAADEPVRTYRGGVLLPSDHPNVAAVATLDVGTADLQQCADAVMRLHAEWSWHQGRRDMSYRAAAGTPLPYARWANGERVVLRGNSLAWEPSGRASGDHSGFRKYLDAVFSWANTVSLARQAEAIDVGDLRPGDFLILPGNPGHSVLVLDMAADGEGRRVLLLGQSYMPAQSFHVLRTAPGQVWFTVDPDSEGIQTPFWPAPFPWSSLRRLD